MIFIIYHLSFIIYNLLVWWIPYCGGLDPYGCTLLPWRRGSFQSLSFIIIFYNFIININLYLFPYWYQHQFLKMFQNIVWCISFKDICNLHITHPYTLPFFLELSVPEKYFRNYILKISWYVLVKWTGYKNWIKSEYQTTKFGI